MPASFPKAPTVLLICVATLCSLAASDILAKKPVPVDIFQVTPDDFTGRKDAQALFAEANEQYRKQAYEAAARAYIELLHNQPGNSLALYNLACCYGLLGAEKQAARFLAASWEAGFRDLVFVSKDTDFDRVRESKIFQKTLQDLQQEADNLPLILGVPAERLALFRLQEPEKVEDGVKYPLLIALHGAGGNDEDFIEFLRDGGKGTQAFFCAVQGPYADDRGGEGFLWFRQATDGDRRLPEPRSLRMSEDAVLRILEELLKSYPIDPGRVFLMGFSQGGFMTYRLGLKHPDRFRGVIPVGGIFTPEDFSKEELKAAAGTKVLLCYSPEDDARIVKSAETAQKEFAAAAIPCEVYPYGGGHILTDELLRRILAWMEK